MTKLRYGYLFGCTTLDSYTHNFALINKVQIMHTKIVTKGPFGKRFLITLFKFCENTCK